MPDCAPSCLPPLPPLHLPARFDPLTSPLLHPQKGSFRDPAKIVELARQCDVLTVEIEHVDVDALEAASKETGVPVCPAPATLR